jgi:hypothetical protein
MKNKYFKQEAREHSASVLQLNASVIPAQS